MRTSYIKHITDYSRTLHFKYNSFMNKRIYFKKCIDNCKTIEELQYVKDNFKF